jgi:hypothetical protein
MMNDPFDLTEYGRRDPHEELMEYEAARGPVNPVPSDEAAFIRAMDSKFDNDRIPY